MDISEKPPLLNAIRGIETKLGLHLPLDEAHAYARGLLSSDKFHPLSAYLVGAKSYLLQEPGVAQQYYYDIFEAARTILIVRTLSAAIDTFGDGLPQSLRTRLLGAKTQSALDDIVFEIVVAAAYERKFGSGAVHFIEPTPTTKTPEFRVSVTGEPPIFVECKRSSRYNSYAKRLGEHVDAKLRLVLDELKLRDLPRVIEVRFKGDPVDVDSRQLAQASVSSAMLGREIETARYSVIAKPLGPADVGFLYPSPKYFANRFGYRPSAWHGFLADVEGPKLGPSFFDSTTWDSAIMWQVDNDEVLRKGLKVNFKLIFKGLEQLRGVGRRTVLHLWLERANGWGNRRDLLQKIYKTLEAPKSVVNANAAQNDNESPDNDLFSFLVFNETEVDVTIRGRFDCQEHCHSIGGFVRWQDEPPITNVFAKSEDMQAGTGEWGIGVKLPSLDEVEESKNPSH